MIGAATAIEDVGDEATKQRHRGAARLRSTVREVRADRIEMVPYDPAWALSFTRESQRLGTVLRGHLVRDIEHIGSTAVPGLCAKAIIDMLAIVDDVDAVAALASSLAALSWVRDPELRDASERRLSFCFPDRLNRTHHLHVVLPEHDGWRGWIAFRDCLRRDGNLRQEYGDLKRRLASEFGDEPNERDAYRLGKADLIRLATASELNRK